jgi:pimeloyl-ACP methyl ester carboxylesterase
MQRFAGRIVLLTFLTALCAQQSTVWHDPSPHKIQFVTVAENVRLEVLDWGGSGRALVLLAGLGATAHTFDEFARKLANNYHVFGVTRRGSGASSVPAVGYGADRLGDDVLEVLDSLKLNKPVLLGSSLGGEELSSVGSRYPGRVSGLIYLDAGYSYAFDNGKGPSLKELLEGTPQPPPAGAADLTSFAAYQSWLKRISGVTVPESELRQMMQSEADGGVGKRRMSPEVTAQILAGMKKYVDIRLPVLAIFAIPSYRGTWLAEDPALHPQAEAFIARLRALTEKQAKVFEEGVPGARVVRLSGSHVIFMSNEADVLREIHVFVATLQ